MSENDKEFKRTKLNWKDRKFVVCMFFHSIFCYMTFKPNQAELEWMIMKLTAMGRFER